MGQNYKCSQNVIKWSENRISLNKFEIVEKIAEKNDLAPADAKDIAEVLFEILKSTLSSGENIVISGFGKFQVNEKASRKGKIQLLENP